MGFVFKIQTLAIMNLNPTTLRDYIDDLHFQRSCFGGSNIVFPSSEQKKCFR